VDDDATLVEAAPDELRQPKAAPAKPKKRPRHDEDEEVVDAEVEDEDVAHKPRKRFSWVVCGLLFVAALGLGSASVAPYLGDPTADGTGRMRTSPVLKQSKDWLAEQYVLPMTIVPVSLALLVIVGMMVAMGTRNFGIVPLLATYLATFAAVGVLVPATMGLFNLQRLFDSIHKEGQRLGKEQVVEVTTGLGAGVQVALIGASLALVLFWASLLVMHRSAFGRILCMVFVVFACIFGGVLVFTTAELPPALQGIF
jgi:hypothetical protein